MNNTKKQRKTIGWKDWRYLKKKIGVIKGHIIYQARDISTYHARIGTVKDRNSKDLTEAEEIKKRWQEYTTIYKKKVLMT